MGTGLQFAAISASRYWVRAKSGAEFLIMRSNRPKPVLAARAGHGEAGDAALGRGRLTAASSTFSRHPRLGAQPELDTYQGGKACPS